MHSKIQFKNQPPLFPSLFPSLLPSLLPLPFSSSHPRCFTEQSLNTPHLFHQFGHTSARPKHSSPSPHRKCYTIDKMDSTLDHSSVQKPQKQCQVEVIPFSLDVDDSHLVDILSEYKEESKENMDGMVEDMVDGMVEDMVDGMVGGMDEKKVGGIEQISFKGIINRASLIGILQEMSDKLSRMWDSLDNADFVVKNASPKTFSELHANRQGQLIDELELHKSATRKHIDDTQVQVSVALQCLSKFVGVTSTAHSQYGLRLLDLERRLVLQIFCLFKLNDVVKRASKDKRARQDWGLVGRAKSK